jgi:hypothetical protein
MTTNKMRDPLLRLLASLPPATPPAALDERVRSRCHIVLERRRLPSQRRELPIIPAGLLNAALAITAGMYAAAAALEALRLVAML